MPTSVPSLPFGTRIHRDTIRRQMVLLAPERAVRLDESEFNIISLVDGKLAVSDIIAKLVVTFADAPDDVIAHDVLSYLQELADRRFLDFCHG